MSSVYELGCITYDDEEELDREVWIRKHPAMLKAEADVDCANLALDVVYGLLSEEWNLCRMPDEGRSRTASEVEAEEEKRALAAAEPELLAVTLHDDLKAAIAKYGVKVPVRSLPEKPAAEKQTTAPAPSPETASNGTGSGA